jgi:ADP-ribose pyrophosphatase YjhB (NUDIX family)
MNEENPWKTVSKKVVYENKWITVEEHDVITPSGTNGIYGVVRTKDIAIAILPLDEDKNTWIVGQYRYTLDSYEWELIEGGCSKNDIPTEAAKRELKEEAGIIASEFELVLEMQLSNSKSDEISYSYIARGLSFTTSEPEETEQLQVKKIAFNDLVNMCVNGTIKDALTISTVLAVDKKINR